MYCACEVGLLPSESMVTEISGRVTNRSECGEVGGVIP